MDKDYPGDCCDAAVDPQLTTDDADSLPAAGGFMTEAGDTDPYALSDEARAEAQRRLLNNEGVGNEMETIRAAVHADPSYAWTWHCNVAVSSMDEGMNHAAANRAAARFMFTLFGLDTSKHEFFASTQPVPATESPMHFSV